MNQIRLVFSLWQMMFEILLGSKQWRLYNLYLFMEGDYVFVVGVFKALLYGQMHRYNYVMQLNADCTKQVINNIINVNSIGIFIQSNASNLLLSEILTSNQILGTFQMSDIVIIFLAYLSCCAPIHGITYTRANTRAYTCNHASACY